MSKMEGTLRAYGLSGTGIFECLEIIDVGHNLKQFDDLTGLTLTPIFYDSLRHWRHPVTAEKITRMVSQLSTTCTDGVKIDPTDYLPTFSVPVRAPGS